MAAFTVRQYLPMPGRPWLGVDELRLRVRVAAVSTFAGSATGPVGIAAGGAVDPRLRDRAEPPADDLVQAGSHRQRVHPGLGQSSYRLGAESAQGMTSLRC